MVQDEVRQREGATNDKEATAGMTSEGRNDGENVERGQLKYTSIRSSSIASLNDSVLSIPLIARLEQWSVRRTGRLE